MNGDRLWSIQLSVLVDPNVDQYYCPSSDSEGFRYMIHAPLGKYFNTLIFTLID